MSDPSGTPNLSGDQRSPSWTAVWRPAWHELDQTLVVGLRQKYFFFDRSPESMSGDAAETDADLIFFNGVDPDQNTQIRFAKVVRIEHPLCGEILRVDTFGLDYILYPVDGAEIVIDAEEEPGTLRSGEVGEACVADWSMKVILEEVSDPVQPPPIA